MLEPFIKSHVNRFGYIQLTILVSIFGMELAQMNINKWGDSWGAGCVVAAVGYALRKLCSERLSSWEPLQYNTGTRSTDTKKRLTRPKFNPIKWRVAISLGGWRNGVAFSHLYSLYLFSRTNSSKWSCGQRCGRSRDILIIVTQWATNRAPSHVKLTPRHLFYWLSSLFLVYLHSCSSLSTRQ